MSQPRVIQADYANWRPVAGRKVLQLILEVPIEQTADVMAKLGVPMPGESRWCAVALLENGGPASEKPATSPKETRKPSSATEAPDGHHGKTPSHISASTVPAGISEIPNQDRRPFAFLPLSQQAAIRCQDNDFKLYLDASDAADAADKVRKLCGVASRSELKFRTDSGYKWEAIETGFREWQTTKRYGSTAR